jgi:hypothetical protein
MRDLTCSSILRVAAAALGLALLVSSISNSASSSGWDATRRIKCLRKNAPECHRLHVSNSRLALA